MKTLLALLLLIPLNLYSELSEWENQTWKCSGQDLNGNGEINGFAECTHKQTNENFSLQIPRQCLRILQTVEQNEVGA